MTKNRIDVQDETAIDVTTLKRFKPYVNTEFPNAHKLHEKLLFLPTHIGLTKGDMMYIVNKVKEFFNTK